MPWSPDQSLIIFESPLERAVFSCIPALCPLRSSCESCGASTTRSMLPVVALTFVGLIGQSRTVAFLNGAWNPSRLRSRLESGGASVGRLGVQIDHKDAAVADEFGASDLMEALVEGGEGEEAPFLSSEGGRASKGQMMTEELQKSLSGSGYKTVGSHSAVKICRWTKQQLMGRAGCYKHTFYGIESHRCMEATTSLACANRCVFCWRHHMHPVGKYFDWETDQPGFILDTAIKEHIGMLKSLRGLPSVTKERWAEASTPKHCALSLVGEPIMYPYINQFLDLLHTRGISSFLVTNGQHPEEIETLRPVTQLYVSVDAPSKEALRAVDRPLFPDFWERLLKSIDALRRKKQRTVFRLTLIKEVNDEDVKGYADLVARGHPDFVEVKGVTFCGSSDAFKLSIKNSPHVWETMNFAERLMSALAEKRESGEEDVPEYGLACEHAHSNSFLLARKDQFFKKGKWHTWIDFDRFTSLATETQQQRESRPSSDEFTPGSESSSTSSSSSFDGPGGLSFVAADLEAAAKYRKEMETETDRQMGTITAADYERETPAWALMGSELQGFDPSLDVRRWEEVRDGRPKPSLEEWDAFHSRRQERKEEAESWALTVTSPLIRPDEHPTEQR
uniref:Radical SAM core domain-containing protein n=1 Tax=Chromera velia CCMP2878 TaxID=1169474 RepID=A0A0G4GG36_9ALVE|eukprot:Cvel_21740.t1-p1 / transcript=Cvel_21740.t1 / gene=Cvel_21740 / organism=Chromera_velia_CCMP2878 / gene_product=tRNA wybutosine-synthesizing protein 1 homolog, putative / transcript_product=tRNA wybutosine-synthesizing protein 1 homolog, putative / location=Cvel_scaffold2065:9558-12720(-) / protein_length=620 / sequence_SO=supercontig / SO=protein_coding / is_pseudo=false